MEEALNEHKELANAIAEGKAERTRELAQQHIENARQSVISVFKNFFQEDKD